MKCHVHVEKREKKKKKSTIFQQHKKVMEEKTEIKLKAFHICFEKPPCNLSFTFNGLL